MMRSAFPTNKFLLFAWPALTVLCAAVFLTQVNQEFYRDEDYEFFYHITSFARLFTLQESQHSWLYQALIFVHDLLFYRHGPLPALYQGVVIGVLDVVGVPMTVKVYQLPVALLAMGTVLLFFHVLLRAGISGWICLAAATLLALSPLFAALGRSLHGYIWVWIAFGHVLGLAALQRLREDGSGRWFLGFAFVNILLGDGLFYLSIGAMVAAYCLAETPLARPFAGTMAGFREVPRRLRTLICWPIVLPPLLALAALGVSAVTTLAFSGSSISQSIPMNSLLLAALHHTPEGFSGITSWRGMQLASVALGEAAPLLAVMALFGFLVKGLNRRTELAFAVIGSLGFGILIYSLAPHDIGTIQTYQIYTLIPFLLLGALNADRLAAVSRRFRMGIALTLAVVLCTAGLSMATFVWHVPLALQPSNFADGDFGPNKPIFGTKAAGELTRQALLPALASGHQNVSATIYHSGDGPTDQKMFGGFRNWFSPYLLFSGLAQNADWYAIKSGHPVNFSLGLRMTPEESQKFGLTCPADMCVDLTLGETSKESRLYMVFDGTRRLVRLRIAGAPVNALPSGSYPATKLNMDFDRKHTRIADLFPSRPERRVEALMTSILQHFGL